MSFEEAKRTFFELLTLKPYNEKISGKLVEIDEAICWVAFDSFQMPPLGPREAYEFLLHTDYREWLEGEADKTQQAFEIAREQVFNAIENGHVAAVGKEAEREMDDPRGEHVPPLTIVTPQMFTNGGWSEAGRAYQIGETTFEGLFVKHDDLIRVFSPFKKTRSAGDSEKMEIPAEVPKAPVDLERARRGRPRKYDWDRVLSEVAFDIGQTGEVPASQAALETMIAERFMDLIGDEPGRSGIRERASGLYKMLRQKSQ